MHLMLKSIFNNCKMINQCILDRVMLFPGLFLICNNSVFFGHDN